MLFKYSPFTVKCQQNTQGPHCADELKQVIDTHLIAPDGVSEVLTLWIMHTHAFDAWDHSGRLLVTSKTPGCGKSVLGRIAETFSSRGEHIEYATRSFMMRWMEENKKRAATLIIDEADTFFLDKKDIRTSINSSFQRGGKAGMSEPGKNNDWKAKIYNGFVPVAILGIGSSWWWPALEERSFIVRLAKPQGLTVPKFKPSKHTSLCARLAEWGKESLGSLENAAPEMPSGVEHRNADKWHPLLAIADSIGGQWPARARELAVQWCGDPDLLHRVRDVFDGRDKIPSSELAEALGMVSQKQLANDLRPWASPKQIWFGGEQKRGYWAKQFGFDLEEDI